MFVACSIIYNFWFSEYGRERERKRKRRRERQKRENKWWWEKEREWERKKERELKGEIYIMIVTDYECWDFL